MLKVHFSKRWYANREAAWVVLVFLLLSTHVGQYAQWILSAVVITAMVAMHHGVLHCEKMPGFFCVAAAAGVGLFMSLPALAQGLTRPWPVLRDLIRATILPLCWVAVALLLKQFAANTRPVFYKTLFLFCGLSSGIDLIVSLPARIAGLEEGFRGFTSAYSVDVYTVAVGLFLSFFHPWEGRDGCYISRRADFWCRVLILLNFALAFSRSALAVLLCIVLPFLLRDTGKFFKFALALAAAALVLYLALPETAEYFFYKIMHSFQEISYDNVWTNDRVVNNWRGYEIFCAQFKFARMPLLNQLLGAGFGSSINVGGYAFLVTTEPELPYLHNGYYTMLIKAGIVGVILNVVYYLRLGIQVLTEKYESFDKMFLLGMLLSMVVASWVVGGVLTGYMVPLFVLAFCWLPQCRRSSQERAAHA